MRTETFKMERPNLVKPGENVKIIERAVAMSGCYKARERILSEFGIVKEVQENDRGFYVIVEFDE